MPVPMTMRPIFDAENPMYCARSPRAVRPSSFMRKLLRLQSAQESPLTSHRLAHHAHAQTGFAVTTTCSTLGSSQSSTATDLPLRVLNASPSPTKPKSRRSSTTKTGPAPTIVLSRPIGMLLSPPKLLVAAQSQSLAIPSSTFYGTKRKRSSGSDIVQHRNDSRKRVRRSSLGDFLSFPVSSSRLSAFSSSVPSASFHPQPHFSLALPYPPYATSSSHRHHHVEEDVLKKTSSHALLKFVEARPKCTDPEHLLAAERISKLHAELQGFEPGAESQRDIEVFIDELDNFVPDVRLKHHLQPLSTLTHQDMASFLASKGCFTPTTLAMFGRANVESIDLRQSLNDEGTMLTSNIEKTLEVFTHPRTFTQLYELNLNDVLLTEESFMLLQPLRSTLQILWLNRTGTTDSMLPHLVCHRKLTNLRLTGNSGVTDESVSNLLYMTALKYLELGNTGLTMDGLRRLAEGILNQERKITLEIPKECDDYMNSLHTQYLVHPSAPLITDPGACGFLALPALKKNLAEHAKFNDTLVVKGSRGELCEALRALLERRRRDMMVRAVMWQRDDEETVRSGEPLDETKEMLEEEDEEDDTYSA